MANQLFSGFLLDDAGDPINGAVVNLYDRNTTTPSRANTTTDSNGKWTISHGTEGRFDVQIVSGDSTRRIKYDDQVQMLTLEVANLNIRNPADTFDYSILPAAIVADRILTLPLITATDTLASLGLAQTFTATQTFAAAVVSSLAVTADDAGALGASGTAFADLFLASGGVINWDSGDITLTDTGTSILTLGGADFRVANGFGIVVGHTAQILTGVTAEFQVLGTGGNDSTIVIGRWSADASPPSIQAVKSRNATIGSSTKVNDNDQLFQLITYPDDNVDVTNAAAIYQAEVDDADPESNAVGVAWLWRQQTETGGALRETWRMTASGQFISAGIVDNPANVTADGSIICEAGIAFTDVANAHIDDSTKGDGTVQHFIGNNTIDTTAPSDARLKENFEPFEGSVLEKLRGLNFKVFDYIPEGNREQLGRTFGLTAQDVQKVWPEYVFERGDGYLQIAYHRMMPALLRGLQELNEKLEAA